MMEKGIKEWEISPTPKITEPFSLEAKPGAVVYLIGA